MPRYVAFLRGVSPMNASMPTLKRCFEAEGFSDVRTLLSSGNVVFSARTSACPTLERRAGKAMSRLDRSFDTFVRPARYLQELVESDPFAEFTLSPAAKRVVVFLRRRAERGPALPIEGSGGSILKLGGSEVLAAYVPGPTASTFMKLLERTFGSDITTRTLETVRKCAWA